MASTAPPNAQYSFKSPRQQLFSFPSDVIVSMLNNPSSHKGLMKLYQTCKYFYGKRPILIADDVKIEIDEAMYKLSHKIVDKDVTFNVQTPVWLTGVVFFRFCSQQVHRLPTFFRCSVKEIILISSEMQFDDFVLLTSENTVETFLCDNDDSQIYHSDNSKASIDQILQHLPNVTKFEYFIDQYCSNEMLARLIEMQFNNTFESFELKFDDVHADFDMNLFCEFINENSNIDTTILLKMDPFQEAFDGETKRKLRDALRKLDRRWKNEAHEGLKEFFIKIKSDCLTGI